MGQLIGMVRQFRDDENGAAMVEYSILVGIIAGAAILAIVAIGLWVSGRFGGLCDILDGKGATGTAGTFGTCSKTGGTGT
jgi:pilus assembly protein Flp/PilA